MKAVPALEDLGTALIRYKFYLAKYSGGNMTKTLLFA